ncbi:MAG: hypothetical protein AAGA54_19935 [Myxococcota bacterium]
MNILKPSIFPFLIAIPVALVGCGDDTDTPSESGSTSMDTTTGETAETAETAEPGSSSSSDPGTTTTTTDDSADSSSGEPGPTGSESSTGAADVAPTVLAQAVNSFQNATATMGAAATVDSQGPVDIEDGVELPGFRVRNLRR